MIAAGVNAKALSTYMGHASVSITFDRYGKLMPGDESVVASQFDAYLARAASAPHPPHSQHAIDADPSGSERSPMRDGIADPA